MALLQVGDVITADSTVEDDPEYAGRVFVQIEPDGARRVIRLMSIQATQSSWEFWKSRWLENGSTFVSWGPPTEEILVGTHRGLYLPYPVGGIAVPGQIEPVNQYGISHKWLTVLSRFAHDLVEFNPSANHLRRAGTHLTGHAPPEDAAAQLANQVTYQLGRAVIGVAWHRIQHWLTLDAEQLAFHPELVPDIDNWQIWQSGTIPDEPDEIPIPNLDTMMSRLCGDAVTEVKGMCVGAWVYQLNAHIGSSSYNTNMNAGGEIRLPDTTRNTWYPQLFLHSIAGTGSERSDQWDEVMSWYREAHDHYLENIAPGIEH